MKSEELDHYKGEKGKVYFTYQDKDAALGAILNSKKFSNHIAVSDRVLDFGCGGGWLLAELACSERIGIEINQEAHNSCRKNGVKVYDSIESVNEREIDVIISHHCLEHVSHPIAALRSLHGLLKKSGSLILVVPIDDWRVQKDYTGTDIDHHLHTWSPRLLANTLVEAGFKIESIKVLTHAWFPKWQLLLGKIPQFCYDMLCVFWSWRCKRRQLIAIVRK